MRLTIACRRQFTDKSKLSWWLPLHRMAIDLPCMGMGYARTSSLNPSAYYSTTIVCDFLFLPFISWGLSIGNPHATLHIMIEEFKGATLRLQRKSMCPKLAVEYRSNKSPTNVVVCESFHINKDLFIIFVRASFEGQEISQPHKVNKKLDILWWHQQLWKWKAAESDPSEFVSWTKSGIALSMLHHWFAASL